MTVQPRRVRPAAPDYTARVYRLGVVRLGSVTHTHEGYVPVCGAKYGAAVTDACLKRLQPEGSRSKAEAALEQHWRDLHTRRAAA